MRSRKRADWQRAALGAVCSLIKRGIAPSYLDEGGIRVLNQKCIRDHQIDFSVARRNDFQKKAVPNDRLIRVGDVLINSTGTGTLGRVAQVRNQPNEPTTVDTHLTIVRPDAAKFFLPFFGYMMIAIEDELIAGGHGASGQTELSRTDLENSYFVSYPTSLDEQRRIVEVLDEAFEGLTLARANAEANLRNASELLEAAIERALEKAEGEPISLEEMIKKGWITGHLDGNHGSDYPRKEEFVSDGVPYISANCITNNIIDFDRCKYLSPERADHLRKGIAKDRDVIFAHNATVGPVALLNTDEERVILSTTLTYYRCNEAKIVPEFLVLEMRSAGFRRQYEAVMAQATRNQVPITMQRTFTHLIPHVDDQRRIADLGVELEGHCNAAMNSYASSLSDIDELRQSLLKKAFSGELT